MKCFADGCIQNRCPNDCHDDVDYEKSEKLERTKHAVILVVWRSPRPEQRVTVVNS